MNPRVTRRATMAGLAAVPLLTTAACAEREDESAAEPVATPSGLAAPGDTIPAVTVKAGFSPYADELLAVAGVARGYFDAVGLTLDPAPNGAQTDLLSSATPLLNGQVELGSGYPPSIASQLDTVTTVRGFAISDVFYGYRILAPAGKYTTLEQAMAGGADFTTALTTVLDQVKGQDVILRDGVVPTFYDLITSTAGGSTADWNITYLSNPDMVRAAQAGQAEFVSPSGAVEITRLLMDGWESLVALPDVIDNLPSDQTVSLRFTFSGYLTTTDYAEANWETLLRFTSVVFRLIDDLEKDPVGVASDFVDYVNSYTGSSLTAEELAGTFDGLYSVRNFEDATEFWTDEGAPFNFDTVAAAQLSTLGTRGVIQEGHTPDELSIAGEVYASLVEYRKAADEQLAAAPDGDLKTQAQSQYDARNYLDAYRLAASAAGAGA